MEKLIELLRNADIDCHLKYTKLYGKLGKELNKYLILIERFFYSDFWINRFKRRLEEENFEYDPILLDRILGTSTCLKEDNIFKVFNGSSKQNGVSNNKTMIGLNINLDSYELFDSHVHNIVLHEFGHRLYNQKEFKLIKDLNNYILKNPEDYIKDKTLTNKDIKYFTDSNELRLRIIPIIKEMMDNNWNSELAYDYSRNLDIDDIKEIYDKQYIIKLLKNIL